MSKKNRQKSRAAQRPSNPPRVPSAVVAEAAAADHAQALEATDESGSTVAESAGDDTSDTTPFEATDTAASGPGSPAATAAEAPTENIVLQTADDVQPHVDAGTGGAADMRPAPVAVAPTPQPFTIPTPAPMASQGDIRGVLIQVAGARLLMPNATIAEVLSYADPEPVGADAPAWLLGRLRWRGWQVPLIAFGTLAGVAEERAVLGSKVVVLKALAGTSRTPYFAMLTQGFPRLVTVSRQTLSVEDDDANLMPPGVQARVRLNEDPALLPDLEAIEALVADAVAHAA